jgi:hypothetical protein
VSGQFRAPAAFTSEELKVAVLGPVFGPPLYIHTHIPPRKAPGTYWVGGWVDPKAGLDGVEETKFLTLLGLELRLLGLLARFFLLVGWDFGYCGHYWPIVPAQGDSDGDCGEVGGMRIGRGNRSTPRKPAPAPLCPPLIPHD